MSMMFEVQRTSVKNFEDLKTQIEQNARESQTQRTQDMSASVQVSEPETEVDGTPDEASGNDVSASTADTSYGNFKGAQDYKDKDWIHALHEVWGTMYQLQKNEPPNQ